MQEYRGKYREAVVVRTSPMLDAPVLFALGRTPTELFLPLPVAALGLWRFGFDGLVIPVALFVCMPRIRRHLGRNRLLHLLWGLGLATAMRLVQRASAMLGGCGGDEVASPFRFRDGNLKRYGP